MKSINKHCIVFVYIFFFTFQSFSYSENKIYVFDSRDYKHKYTLLIDDTEWTCTNVSGKREYVGHGGNHEYHIVWSAVHGKSINFPISFEFMRCRKLLKQYENPPHHQLDLSGYLCEFFAYFNVNLSRGKIDLNSPLKDDYLQLGDNYCIRRGLAWRPTFGHCEALLLQDGRNAYIMLAWIDGSITDEETRNYLFEKMRSLITPNDW